MILAEGARRYFFHRHVTAYIDLLYLDCQTKRATLVYVILSAFTTNSIQSCTYSSPASRALRKGATCNTLLGT